MYDEHDDYDRESNIDEHDAALRLVTWLGCAVLTCTVCGLVFLCRIGAI